MSAEYDPKSLGTEHPRKSPKCPIFIKSVRFHFYDFVINSPTLCWQVAQVVLGTLPGQFPLKSSFAVFEALLSVSVYAYVVALPSEVEMQSRRSVRESESVLLLIPCALFL